MKLLAGVTAILLLLQLISAPALAGRDDKKLERLVDDYWQEHIQASPLLASAFGDKRYSDQLDDVSEASYARRAAMLDKYIVKLNKVKRQKLNRDNRLTAQVLDWILQHERERLDYPWHYVTFNTFFGWHTGFAQAAKIATFSTEQDYRNFIRRLQQFGRYADQHIALMQKGIDTGYVQACAPMVGYEQTIGGFITERAEDSVFYTGFKRFPVGYSKATVAALQAEARSAIESSVLPGYQRFYDFFMESYQPACRQAIGVSNLPRGRELYNHFVRYFTSLDIDANAVHTLGLSEVKRIRAEMDELIQTLDFKGDFKAFVQHLRSDPQFYADSEEAYMNAAAVIAKRIDGVLPEFFSKLPRISYGVRPIDPALAPKTAAAYAQGASADRTSAGQMRLNTYKLASRPLYGLTSLTLHEAMPGHIMQGALQQELEGLPDVRRFYGFNAYSEGWALYTERLGEEMGVYQTPYDSFGRLGYEMWRACRLVVDTGIHSQGWTRQQAIDYMAENTGLSMHNITTEVDRYISWPGQALAYKYGELKIRELRARAEKALGSRFSLREFHAVVLNEGQLPLMVLEQVVDEWIEKKG